MSNDLTLWHHLNVATMNGGSDKDAFGWMQNACLISSNDKILFAGLIDQAPQELRASILTEVDLKGACVTPGLIDCHTHLVYAGNRAREFEMRLEGASYEDIARAGGGIRSTVAATRAASEEQLLTLAIARAKALMREGVTTLEVKSGYGLSEHDEARCLRVARKLAHSLPLTVRTTYLAAHALPPEYANQSDAYIDAVCAWLPTLHAEGLVDAVDAFCEGIGFDLAQTEKVLQAAKRLGLPVKLHAEQLSNLGGSVLAAGYRALSSDHLEYLDSQGIEALKASGSVAVLLPGAYYYLREKQLPPISALRAAGVPMALATDHNPGSSPCLSTLLIMNMACTLFRLTPAEAWQGFTTHAAKALGLPPSYGQLSQGSRADFAVWEADHPRDLVYRFGHHPLAGLVQSGQLTNG